MRAHRDQTDETRERATEFLRRIARSQCVDLDGAMQFRQLFAAALQEETMVAIDGRFEPEQPLERDLENRRWRQITAPYHAIDPGLGIVDDRDEMIGKGTVTPPKNRISEERGRVPRQIVSVLVVEVDCQRIELNAKRSSIDPPIVRPDALIPTSSRIGVATVGCGPPLGAHLCSTAIARIHPPLPSQAIEHLFVPFALLGLKSSNIPIEPEPGEIPFQMVDIARFRTLPIEILESKGDLGARAAGIQPAEQRGEQRTRMRSTRRRRRKPTSIENRTLIFHCHCNRFVPVVRPSRKITNRIPSRSDLLYATERRTKKYSMHSVSDSQNSQGRRVGLRLTARSLAPRVKQALRVLGDPLEEPAELDRRLLEEISVWIVDADRLGDFSESGEAPDTRLLLIAPKGPGYDFDRRILAQTTRPGRLGAVYEMLQSALERTPRRCPHIPTKLSARCIHADRRSIGAVLSLSESGCLLRTSEAFRRGTQISLQFALPDYGRVSTRAECRYTRRGDAGLAF